jgi:Flp pilus assembly protein TadD
MTIQERPRTGDGARSEQVWSGRRVRAAGLILAAATFLAYLPALSSGFVFDDDVYIIENAALGSRGGLMQIWLTPTALPQYYPVVFTSFWVEHHIWGNVPLGYHAVNVALHIVNAILVWVVLRRLEVKGAFLAAAIFALHPVHVESVAWVTERKNVMSGMFSLLALLAWWRFLDRRSWRSYALVLSLFTCAMLCKTMAVTLPFVFLLLVWGKEPSGWRRELRWVWPLLLVAVALGLVTAWREHVEKAINVLPHLSVLDRSLIAGRALWFYAEKLLWPTDLAFIYPRWTVDSGSPWAYAFPAAALLVPVCLWYWRQRVGRAPLVAVVFFALTLSPVLGFANFNFQSLSYVADHFQYLASIGVIALAAGVVTSFFERLGSTYRWLGVVGAGMLLCVLGVLTWRQCHIYASEETLWLDTLAKNPLSAAAHYNLGRERARQGRLDEAEVSLRAALRIEPDSELLHNNLAVLLSREGRLDEAIEQVAEAVRLNPNAAETQSNLATLLARKGDLDGAVRHFSEALRIQPDWAWVHSKLAALLAQRGDVESAVLQLQEAVRLSPENANMRVSLGVLLMRQGKLEDAIRQFSEALRIQPDHASARRNLQAARAQMHPR